MSVTIVLPYPPSANRHARHVRGGHYTPAAVKTYRELAAWRARQAGIRPLEGPVHVEVVLYPCKPRRPTPRPVRRIDLGNCEKVVSDALNGVAWVDDKQHHRIDLVLGEPIPGGALLVTIAPCLEPVRPWPFYAPVEKGLTCCSPRGV